ncbi:MAG: hypothetical protein IJ615_10575 [Bacteroidaceae bacterium]|nr:hypothetical protein [Bacteroidaceae bacterium]
MKSLTSIVSSTFTLKREGRGLFSLQRGGGMLLLCLLFSCLSVRAQVQVDVKLDSAALFIGQQTGLTLSVTYDAKQKLKMPDIKKGQLLIPDIEVVEVGEPDTAVLNEGKRLTVSQAYTITAWDSALYFLPPMQVMVDTNRYESNSLALKVLTVDVDTLHLDQFFPPNGIMELPFLWEDWRLVMFGGLLFVLMLVCIGYLYYHVKHGKPIVRFIRRKKKLPPHQVAMSEIERIKSERKWAEEDSKEYYTLLTDTLRNYIRDRYGFNAMEMTSTEIIERLISENNEEALDELREIFRTADLVKFAKYSTLINENDANLVSAIEYVNQTKIEVDPNAKPEPEVIKETDQKRLTQVKIMRVAIGVLAVLSLAVLAWIIWRSADLLM